MKFRSFIEDNFLIDDAETGQLVPFKFRPVQERYYEELCKDYSEANNFRGLREILLKARKEGFTSFILGIFAADIIYNSSPPRYLELSYKDDATKQHFRRIKTFILSYFKKKTGIEDEQRLEKMVFKSINEGSEFVLAHNGASFYVGTASVRTGERGGTVQGILFSECAHYPDTGVLSVSEIIEGTSNMVMPDSGMIFMETTANGRTDFYRRWQQAKRGESLYKPRFFSWKEFWTPEQFELIKKGFGDKRLIAQEYPDNDEVAFLASIEGRTFRRVRECVRGKFEDPKSGHIYVAGIDLGKHDDFTVINIFDRKDNHLCYFERFNKIDWPFQKARIAAAVKRYNNALTVLDASGLGDPIADDLTRQGVSVLPFKFTSNTKRELVEKLSIFIEQGRISYPYLETYLIELENFGYEGITAGGVRRYIYEAPEGFHDDCVMAMGLAVSELHEITPEKKPEEKSHLEKYLESRQMRLAGEEAELYV